MYKVCKNTYCRQNFEVTLDDLKFYEKVSPVFNGKKYQIPAPDLCPQCREQIRLLFRNERKLYHRKCDLSGKQIISIYSADKPYKVYDQKEWWSDKWDGVSYGRDYDFNRDFFEQLSELNRIVPHISLFTTNTVNSEYTNYALNIRNCYLVFGAPNDEDCMYSKFITDCKDVVDCLSLYNCELCYQGVASEKCYNCRYFVNCRNCSDSLLIEDCQGCRNCIGCFGLRSKEYYVMNKFVGKERFDQISREFQFMTLQSFSKLYVDFEVLKSKLPHRASYILGSENCSGDMVFNSKNCLSCFDIIDSEDCKFVAFMPKAINSYDCTFGSPDGVEASYNLCSTTGTRFSMGNFLTWNCSETFYSIECHNSRNLFGCLGLRNKQYCILNKQYTKEEYEELAGRIIEQMILRQAQGDMSQWGDFLPAHLSAFGYNETIAYEYYPFSKEEVISRGWQWYDDQVKQEQYLGPETEVADDIRQVEESICSKILICVSSGKAYKIIPQELKFYQSMGLPVPKKCPDQRHSERMHMRNTRRLWTRSCMKCGKAIETTYAPERPERVYCEECYVGEVY